MLYIYRVCKKTVSYYCTTVQRFCQYYEGNVRLEEHKSKSCVSGSFTQDFFSIYGMTAYNQASALLPSSHIIFANAASVVSALLFFTPAFSASKPTLYT